MPKTIVLIITVTPNARQSVIVSRDGTSWKVRVAAKPVEGAANAAVVALVAETLHLPKSLVTVTHGHRSRHKRVEVLLP